MRTGDSKAEEFHYLEDEGDPNNMPIITLEVMSDHSEDTSPCNEDSKVVDETGVHFLSGQSEDIDEAKETSKKSDLYEYVLRNDGSVVCKLCGEILQSRTHWYRHKYKLHVIQPLNPAPLFQCEQCLVFFKSRKGYIGHLASRHGETLADSSPMVSTSQIEVKPLETYTETTNKEIKEEPDFELTLPKTTLPNYQTTVVRVSSNKPSEGKKVHKSSKESSHPLDWEERRSREEKLVADIINRVKRECEAQGTEGARRGYTRRTTVMHT